MKNKIYIVIIIIALLFVVISRVLVLNNYKKESSPTLIKSEMVISPKDATYIIEGQSVTLKYGISVVPTTSDSVSNITTKYFGNEVTHDFDGDGRIDTAFIITQNSGGSGTFYYLVAGLNTINGYVGSQGLFLGDRISPQNTEIGKGNIVVVNYAERKPQESFAVPPSINKSIWLLLDIKTMQFGEVVQNFEGEADPVKMTLGMKSWTWINTRYSDGKEIKPHTENKFILKFKNDKTFSATTDCNGVGGEYSVNGNKILFSRMISTLMYCENSQEADFTNMLRETQNYFFTSKGELVLGLNLDSGSVIFK